MILAAFIATWWAGFGLVVGVNRAATFPGPQDSLAWAGLWAAGWPFFWLCEEPRHDH